VPNLLAMSFEGELAPSFDLLCLQPNRHPPDGWGIAYYPGGEPSATVLKEPAPPHGSIRSELVRAWEHLESSLFLLHIRTATWGQISHANTQPFTRPWGGRDWLFGHAGSLNRRLELAPEARFWPVGSTDTEMVFCRLLDRMASRDARAIGDVDPAELRAWFDEINAFGGMTSVLCDGHDLCVYADGGGAGDVYLWELLPPHEILVFGDADLEVDLTRRGIKSRKGVIVSTTPLGPLSGETGEPRPSTVPQWRRISPGDLVIVRQGAVRAEARAARPSQASGAPVTFRPRTPLVAPVRRLEITHRTVYRYETPVERSTHLLRLTPFHDRWQSLLAHEVVISVDGQRREYEDVFGNQVCRLEVEEPFGEMVIEARSRVENRDTDPLSFRAPYRARGAIPLVWMPWQRHMLQPYLLPPELAETELHELTDYAMSFVERNDYNLLDTLLDLNFSIFKEYRYRSGSTTLATTPFEVYTNRTGVCQDFANLFICLARLLSIPARYVCGYLYTGPRTAPTTANTRQAEASHAWLQTYLPEAGWKGFDPTNGVLTQTDHVRVAYGRNYVDATPTSGTIFVGGGTETLEVDVRVEPWS
jgi:transglutaminase-like putative cysteine protease/predicted glutamine amidotransferase